MTKKLYTGMALLATLMLFSYFLYPHISISWDKTRVDSSGTTTQLHSKTSALPGIIQAGQGKTWVCPMHPGIMQDHPGTCPICGMDLVEAKNHNGHDHGIQVDSASIQNLGVRLARVKRTNLSREIPTYGNVEEDGSATYNIHSKFEGLIKKTYIHSLGQKIEKGQVIYEIYAPELIAQQKEFIRFLERRNQLVQNIGDARYQENEYLMNLLQDFSRERTRFLHEDVSLDTVQKIEDSGSIIEVIKIIAAESGVVTAINAREGSYVMPSAALFTLSDVSRVWIDIALYPDQADQVHTGDEVIIKSADGQRAKSRISFINPISEGNKASARVAIGNRELHLHPGSFVDVLIQTQPHVGLSLPRSAVMHGGDGDRVMLSRGSGHFMPIHIETGIESGDRIEITDGLLENAEVAVNGQFLLDADASMNAAAQRMQETHPHP